ncbi:MAG: hypothetical protein JWO51_2451 [Rhodospirillales bacterium]|nr:hypothetical protein [Rhodospirillales bacterium]
MQEPFKDLPKPTDGRLIAGFWRRIGAFLIDGLVLGLVGVILGWIFYDALASLGSLGHIIGWVIAIAYLAPMNSWIGDGQTIGKRVVGIKVVGFDGQAIGFGRSMVRSAVLATPVLLNGCSFSIGTNEPSLTLTALGCLMSLIVFGGLASELYLYLFNIGTRQTLHDLAAGTVVVTETSEAAIEHRTPKLHRAIVASLLVLAATGPLLLLNQRPDPALSEILALVQSLPDVSNARVAHQTFYLKTTDAALKSNEAIVVVAVLSHVSVSLEAEAGLIAQQVLSKPDLVPGIPLAITVIHGFDLGIASSSATFSRSRTAQEWANSGSAKASAL